MKKTKITSFSGTYRYARSPLGLHNASGTFQCVLNMNLFEARRKTYLVTQMKLPSFLRVKHNT